MQDFTRRSALAGGAALAAGMAATLASGPPTGAQAAGGEYLWAVNTVGFAVPSDTWVRIPWTSVLLDTSSASRVPFDNTRWIFPSATASGIYQYLVNMAWDNAVGQNGTAIAPVTHRKLLRIVQQDVGTPQLDVPVFLGSSTDLTFHADLNRPNQRVLSDGSKGYQQQQAFLQFGVGPTQRDQRTWAEVYQTSGQTLMCRWDGTAVARTATRPPITGLQAPSIMIAKVADHR